MHLKTSFQYMRRSPFQALSAVSVLAITFFIGTLFAILLYGSNQVLSYFETRPQVIAFLKDDATVEEIDVLTRKLEADSRVTDLDYVSKEEALEIYREATADNPQLAELVSPSIFPSSLEFSVMDLSFAQEVVNEVREEEIVESVGFTASLGNDEQLNDVVETLKNVTFYVRAGGIVLAGVLIAASFLVLLIVIGMRIASRREEVETLSLIGAKPGFIRAPFVLEAINYSIFGVIGGWLAAVILILYTTPSIISYFGEIPVLPADTRSFFLLLSFILAIELLIGIIIALGGSTLAISRARKK